MKNFELIKYVQKVHAESQQEVVELLEKAVHDRDLTALSYDNTSKVITKLWDALDVIVQELNKEE